MTAGHVLAYLPSPPQGVWNLGPFPLRAYALCIIIGIVVAVWWSDRRWQARGGRPGDVLDVALIAVPFGLIGGRIYHVITDWWRYFGDDGKGLAAVFQVWDGGLGIWGAVAFGAVGGWIGCRWKRIKLPPFGDAIAPAILAAQAIGRLGNYFNQELFGEPTTVPWGLELFERVDPDTGRSGIAVIDGVSNGNVLEVAHPTFLYELIWNLLIVALLVFVDRRFQIGHGRLFALYVAGYCVGRFGIEMMRSDEATHILGLRVNVLVSALVFLGAALYVMLAPRGREKGLSMFWPDRAEELAAEGHLGYVSAELDDDEDDAYDAGGFDDEDEYDSDDEEDDDQGFAVIDDGEDGEDGDDGDDWDDRDDGDEDSEWAAPVDEESANDNDAGSSAGVAAAAAGVGTIAGATALTSDADDDADPTESEPETSDETDDHAIDDHDTDGHDAGDHDTDGEMLGDDAASAVGTGDDEDLAPETADSETAESETAESETAEPEAAESDESEQGIADTEPVGPEFGESGPVAPESDAADTADTADTAEPDTAETPAGDGADGEATDADATDADATDADDTGGEPGPGYTVVSNLEGFDFDEISVVEHTSGHELGAMEIRSRDRDKSSENDD
ncbi:prolipoprotein diacylglyceryl transferase [Gordonia sp. HY002]|uniref:prolipoprotein diacylglyceryl transferase n=1 Tax=Gordonia zhenghanii TaxID=2911516 RepID=UPI001EFF98E5|nr:prolipoprotein diacylglyceryl transferase [Gordonia zhenghanii]MCF8570706.1 prolipoprotein diacylglyceryl transferase [Gordonia zhenghanii]